MSFLRWAPATLHPKLYMGSAGHVSITYIGKVVHYINVGSVGCEHRIEATKKGEVKIKHEMQGIHKSFLFTCFFVQLAEHPYKCLLKILGEEQLKFTKLHKAEK